MAHWYLKHDNTKLNLEFETQPLAEAHRSNMGEAFVNLYEVCYQGVNPKISRMMNEGLMKNDLIDILYPVISIDEYVPSDPETDHIVLAFYIKGVPEAVLPFQHFIEKCNGVLFVDHGDSDTIKSTSVIYIEMDRNHLNIDDIDDIIKLSSVVAGLNAKDFSMRFPHTDKKFPYDINLMKKYFMSRNIKNNLDAQKEAELKAEKAEEEKIQKLRDQKEQAQKDAQKEKQDKEDAAKKEQEDAQKKREAEAQRSGQNQPKSNPQNTDTENPVGESIITRMVSLI